MNASDVQAAERPVLTPAGAAHFPSKPREDVMTEPAAPYPYPYPHPGSATAGPSPDGTAPPMPSEVTNERRQRHPGGRLRMMMRRVTRRP
jgi:hypothetical protein